MKRKTVLTALLALAAALSLGVAALADGEFTQTIRLTAEAEVMQVTVPTNVQLVLRSDGTNLVATGSAEIRNGSALAVKVEPPVAKYADSGLAAPIEITFGTGAAVGAGDAATIAGNTSAAVNYAYTGSSYSEAYGLIESGVTVTYTVSWA